MPTCPLLLIAFNSDTSIPGFLSILGRHEIKPIIQAKVVRWILLPSKLSTAPLLSYNNHWDLLLVLPTGTALPSEALRHIKASWDVVGGIPSRIIQDFSTKNAKLLNPLAGSVKPAEPPQKATALTSQSLELSPELSAWVTAQTHDIRKHPVSMLNLLSFMPGKKEQYKQYGAAFAEKVGSRHGGDAKIVGHVVGGQAKDEGWHEIAIAHYPSLEHFAAMISSRDYQEVNQKYRLGSLLDTFILCTMEIDDHGELAGRASIAAKM
jgi:uncharacterized protein (DUF1330 family)